MFSVSRKVRLWRRCQQHECWNLFAMLKYSTLWKLFCAMKSLVGNKVNSKSVLCKYCQSLLHSLVYFKYNLGKYQGKGIFPLWCMMSWYLSWLATMRTVNIRFSIFGKLEFILQKPSNKLIIKFWLKLSSAWRMLLVICCSFELAVFFVSDIHTQYTY